MVRVNPPIECRCDKMVRSRGKFLWVNTQIFFFYPFFILQIINVLNMIGKTILLQKEPIFL